jgi:predicted O-methyltransferase YrrM
MITPTKESLDMVRAISDSVPTFHHHFHILYDIARLFTGYVHYAEIGTYRGASACLMLQRPMTIVLTIDKGEHVNKDEVLHNLDSCNIHNNRFIYIEGDSHTEKIKDAVKGFLGKIDILYIDGDHSREGIIRDFELYEPLVSKDGYIVFDDYNDRIYNPQVHDVIYEIVSGLLDSSYAAGLKEYQIIGTLENNLGAYCLYDIKGGNCFIVKKLVWKRK